MIFGYVGGIEHYKREKMWGLLTLPPEMFSSIISASIRKSFIKFANINTPPEM